MLVSIVDIFLDKFPKNNIIIVTPKGSITETLKDRLEKYNLDNEDRIKVVNVFGFIKTKEFSYVLDFR